MHGQRALIVLLVCLLFAPTSRSLAQSHVPPPPVDGIAFNDVIRLSQSGLSDKTIIAQIRMRPQPLNLSPDELLQLKSAHVSDRVIEAMVGATDPVAPAISAIAPQSPNPVGVQSSKVNDGKIRVYVTDRPITEVISMIRGGSEGTAHASGSAYGNRSGFNANYSAWAQQTTWLGGIENDNRGGADPRTFEVSADILADCHTPNLVVTNDPAAADYVMDFRRQEGTRSTFFTFGGLPGLAVSSAMKVDHAALYAANGDLIYASNARTVGGAVKEICSHFK